MGTGTQLIACAFVVLICACLGFLSPANRGVLLTAMLLLFVFMGETASPIFMKFVFTRLCFRHFCWVLQFPLLQNVQGGATCPALSLCSSSCGVTGGLENEYCDDCDVVPCHRVRRLLFPEPLLVGRALLWCCTLYYIAGVVLPLVHFSAFATYCCLSTLRITGLASPPHLSSWERTSALRKRQGHRLSPVLILLLSRLSSFQLPHIRFLAWFLSSHGICILVFQFLWVGCCLLVQCSLRYVVHVLLHRIHMS